MGTTVVDLGQARGLALVRARGARIRHVAADIYSVPSATGNGGYVVDALKNTCTCAAHEETGIRCKHLWAAAYHRNELTIPTVETAVSVPARPTYPQNWAAYNAAQCEEKARVQILLKSLCGGITEKPQVGRGRPRMPLRDVVFCAVMKVYGTLSGRRSTTDLRTCEEQGHVEHAPAYNSIFRLMERADLMPLLKTLVEESAKPLRAIERTFAADATGFATETYVRWFDHAHGADRRVQQWVKCHAMIGTATNVITAVDVTAGNVNDSPQFVGLVERTAANGFDMQEVSADKAYLSHANLAAVGKIGGVAYVPFKTNSGSTGSVAWENLYHFYSLRREAFLEHYHMRSNVESTFSAMKRKFGPSLRSKTPAAQFNEVLLKCLCFNLSMLVHSIHELNVDPEFWMPKNTSK